MRQISQITFFCFLLLCLGCKNNNDTLTDIDGNEYHIVKIGTQTWMAENLKVTHYNNGDQIPIVPNNSDWTNLNIGSCCDYDNNKVIAEKYGKIYNWFAINDSRNIAPKGWHVATNEDWITLTNFVGGENTAGVKLKQSGTQNWKKPNKSSTNETGFLALPGGYRDHTDGRFYNIYFVSYWWSSTQIDDLHAYCRFVGSDYDDVLGSDYKYNAYDKKDGFSIRCVKDSE